MLTNKFRYELVPLGDNFYRVNLCKIGDDKKAKVFDRMYVPNIEGVINHMESLTDTICTDFFKGATEI